MSETASSVAVSQLRAFVERIERIESDIKELNAIKSDIYKEMRGDGYDVTAVRKVVAKRKLDSADREEQDAIFDLYWTALHGSAEDAPRARAHTRGASSEITETQESVEQTSSAVGSTPAGSASDAIPATNLHSSPSASPATNKAEGSGNSVPSADNYEPPAFLLKPAKPLRPHCQRPHDCGGYGSKHCHSCKTMAMEGEAA